MKKNIVFFGSHGVAIPMLDHLSNFSEVNLCCVVSQPDRASGRGGILKPTAISTWTLGNNIELLRPEKPDEDLSNYLQKKKCDIILIMAYGHILRENILNLPPLGIYNFHSSILPKYRGASPVETAIACGEQTTGVSLMEVVKRMDAGDIVDIESVKIANIDFASDVYNKISSACVTIADRQIHNLISENIIRRKQSDGEATFTRKITKRDGQVDFQLSAREICDRMRGFHEHVGTFTKLNGIVLNIGHATAYDNNLRLCKPGEILSIDGEKIIVAARESSLAIYELQRSGGKMLEIMDFVNGFKINSGDIFEASNCEPIISPTPFKYKKE